MMHHQKQTIFYQTHSKVKSLTFESPLDWWSENWDYLNDLSYKNIMTTYLLAQISLFFLIILFLRIPLSDMLSYVLSQTVTEPLAVFIISALFALPGLLFKKSYQLKPLFIGFLSVIFASFLSNTFLLPLGYKVNQVYLFSMVSIIIQCVALLVLVPTIFMTWFTHNWKKGLQRTGFVLVVITFLLNFFVDHGKNNEIIFAEKNTSIAKVMAGKRLSTADFISEMSDQAK